MFEIAQLNLEGLMTQCSIQSRQKVRVHGKQLKYPARLTNIWQFWKNSCSKPHTVQHVITVWVPIKANIHVHSLAFLFLSSSCPATVLSTVFLTENASHIPPATTQCVCVCVFSGCATVSVCPAVAHLSTAGQSHTDNNVFSVFPELMSVKTLFMTHTTYTPSSAWKYHSRAHTHTVENDCAWELGEF